MTMLSHDFILGLARKRQAELIARTQELVRLDTQTPPSDTRRAADVAARMLSDIPGIDVMLIESVSPVMNLVARLDGGQPGRRLVLSGHLDTYPIGEGAWTHPPLGGEVHDGRLYGRGSADMKGACVTMIETLRILAEHARPFPGEVVLALAGDEERMGELGTQWLIDNVPEVHGDGVIVADVGGPHTVRLGEKGMIWLDLYADGRQAHGAHVHAGINAADRLIDALIDLRRLEDMTPAHLPEVDEIISSAASFLGADNPTARAVMRRVTVNVGIVSSGTSANLVPAGAEAKLDIRIPLGLNVKTVEAEIAGILSTHEGIRSSVTRRYEPTWTPADSPVAVACLTAAEQTLGRTALPDMRIGGSDARLWRRAGFETVVHGLTPNNLGSPDESLETDELWKLLAIECLAAQHFFINSRLLKA